MLSINPLYIGIYYSTGPDLLQDLPILQSAKYFEKKSWVFRKIH